MVDNVVREIQDGQGQGNAGEPRKTNREIAAERRAALADRFKAHQEKAEAKIKDNKRTKLKTMALSQLKDSIKRLSDDYNFNFRGIDGSTRLYLGKGKTERDANMTSQEASSIFKSTRK